MSRIAHENRQARRVEGGKVILKESAPGGLRKVRTANHQLAVETRLADGSKVLRSPDGRTYRSVPMK